MTQPQTAQPNKAFAALPDPGVDALDAMERTVVGNHALIQHPNVAAALTRTGASPAQAGVVSQYLDGVRVQQMVTLHRATGSADMLPLTLSQVRAAEALGINLDGVYQSPEQLLQKQQDDIKSRGNVPIVVNGQVVGERPQDAGEKHRDGWFDSFGGFVNHLAHNPATDAVTEANNVVQNGVAGGISDVLSIFTGPEAGKQADLDKDQEALIRALGYDPHSPFSKMALESKGLDVGDVSKLVRDYGLDKVTQAALYDKDPAKYMQGLADQGGSPEEVAKRLQDVSAQDFQDLIAKYRHERPTVGNLFARAQLNLEHAAKSGGVGGTVANALVGVENVSGVTEMPKLWASIHAPNNKPSADGKFDPLLDSKFDSYAGATDFASSFILDPTLAAGKGLKALRIASAGLDSLGDTGRFAQVMLEGKGLWAKRAQAQLRNAVDNANHIRETRAAYEAAQVTDDVAKIAETKNAWVAANARFDAGSGAYSPVKDQLMGKNQFVKYSEDGATRVVADGEHLDTFDKALNYLVERHQLSQLAFGNAARELPYAPGALSSWAATRVRQGLAESRALKRADKVIDLTKPGVAGRVLASADDSEELWSGMTLSAREQVAHSGDRVAQLQSRVAGLENALANHAESVASGVKYSGQGGAMSDAERFALLTRQRDQASKALQQATQESGAAASNLKSAERAARQAVEQSTGLAQDAAVGDAMFAARGGGQGIMGALGPSAVAERMKLAAQRMPWVQLPRHNVVDITKQSDKDNLLAFARTYLPSQHVDEIRALWDGGDMGIRRNLVRSTNLQVAHAAGLGKTKAGRELMERLFKDDPELYAVNGHSSIPFDPMTGKQDASFAVVPGQVRTEYKIADFKQVHQAAAKIGLFEATLGKAFTSRIFDKTFNVLRFGMLATPRTVPRNTIDTRLMMASRGLTHDMISAKAWLRDNGGVADRHILARVGMENAFTGAVGKAYRTVAKGSSDDLRFLDEVKEFAPHDFELAKAAMSIGRRSDINVDDRAAEAARLLEEGFKPAGLFTDFKREGWEEFEPYGSGGADRWSDSLGVAMHRTPELTKAVVRYLEATGETRVRAFDDVLGRMREPETAMWVKQMEFSHIHVGEDNTPRMAVTDTDRATAETQLAWRMVNTMKDMLTDSNGNYISKVADVLKNGVVPDADWIRKNLPKAVDRPVKVIGPRYVPKVVDPADTNAVARQKLAQGLQDVTGKFYQRVVEDQIAATVALPSLWAFYLKARKAGEFTRESLIAGGIDESAAWNIVHHNSLVEARHRVTDFIDDPAVRSQFDIVNRNLVMFPRASMQFINRLWRMEKYDPSAIRKGFLALNGAENVGLVYRDQYGELNYTLPGSELLTDSLLKIGHVLGISDMAMVPITSTLSGKVVQSVPGYDNPFRMGMSPMVNVPFRYLAAMAPEHATMLHEIDHWMNGSTGAGANAVNTVLPGTLKRFWDAWNPDERDGMVASATRSALTSLYAADPDGSKGIFPVGAKPGSKELQQFVDRVRTQVRNQFTVRALMAMFVPSAPSAPGEEVKGATDADKAYAALGFSSLDGEYKALLNQLHGDVGAATQTWAAMHPDKLIFTAPTTASTTPGVSVPATKAFQSWVEGHLDFIKKYPDTWAHFAPDTKGPFDSLAYHTQLDMGLRKHLTGQEFIEKYQVQRQVNDFFVKDDVKKQALADAMRSGDTMQQDQIKRDYRNQSQAFMAANPLVSGQLNPDPRTQMDAVNAVADLRQMLADPQAPVGDRGALTRMLSLYDQYTSVLSSNGGSGSSAAATRAKQVFSQQMARLVVVDPELKSVYNGVFRKLNIGLKSLASQLAAEAQQSN